MNIVSLVLTWVLLLAGEGNAQDKRDPIRMAVIPFEDILGNASPDATKFTQVLLSHLSREEKLAARVAKPDKPGTVLDRETALALAKKQDAVYLITGRVIDATTDQGNSGLPIPKLGRVNSNSVTSEVKVEMEIISVASGKTVERLRAEGKETLRSNQTWVNSRLGSINLGGSTPAHSPMGHAMNECAEKLVKRMLEILISRK